MGHRNRKASSIEENLKLFDINPNDDNDEDLNFLQGSDSSLLSYDDTVQVTAYNKNSASPRVTKPKPVGDGTLEQLLMANKDTAALKNKEVDEIVTPNTKARLQESTIEPVVIKSPKKKIGAAWDARLAKSLTNNQNARTSTRILSTSSLEKLGMPNSDRFPKSPKRKQRRRSLRNGANPTSSPVRARPGCDQRPGRQQRNAREQTPRSPRPSSTSRRSRYPNQRRQSVDTPKSRKKKRKDFIAKRGSTELVELVRQKSERFSHAGQDVQPTEPKKKLGRSSSRDKKPRHRARSTPVSPVPEDKTGISRNQKRRDFVRARGSEVVVELVRQASQRLSLTDHMEGLPFATSQQTHPEKNGGNGRPRSRSRPRVLNPVRQGSRAQNRRDFVKRRGSDAVVELVRQQSQRLSLSNHMDGLPLVSPQDKPKSARRPEKSEHASSEKRREKPAVTTRKSNSRKPAVVQMTHMKW